MTGMMRLRRPLEIVLIVIAVFLGLSAIPGGIALLAGLGAPPVEQLEGSVFADFTIPGLALLLLVGGSAALATVLLVRRSRFALLSTIAAGLVVMAFEFVEVLAFGSPPGPGRIMQILYFGVGVALVVASLGILLIDILSVPTAAEPK